MGRARLASIGDWLFFACLGLAFLVDVTGGVRVGRSWYRITATDRGRQLAAALAITIVRHVFVRHPSLRERLAARRTAHDRPLEAPTRREWLIDTGVLGAITVWLLNSRSAPVSLPAVSGTPFVRREEARGGLAEAGP